jgi:hypothetical protein
LLKELKAGEDPFASPFHSVAHWFFSSLTLLILQIEHFTDRGGKVPNTTQTSPISRSPTHPKLNFSMLPVPVLPCDDARSMPSGEAQIAQMRIGQLRFLNASLGCRSTERPSSDDLG